MHTIEFDPFKHFNVLSSSIYSFAFIMVAYPSFDEPNIHTANLVENDLWISLENNLNIQSVICNEIGSLTLYTWGLQLAKLYGPKIVSKNMFFKDIIEELNYVYHICHVSTEPQYNHVNKIGAYKHTRLSDNTVRIVSDTPYCCSFELGLITGLTQIIKPLSVVEYEPGIGQKKDGSLTSSFIVRLKSNTIL